MISDRGLRDFHVRNRDLPFLGSGILQCDPGTPTTVAPAGTGLTTPTRQPILAHRPTEMAPKTVELEPMITRFPGWDDVSFFSSVVPPSTTPL